MYLISPRPNVKISHVIHLLVSAVSTWSMVLRVVSFRKALPPSQAEQPVQYSKQVGLNILISSFEGHLPNKSQPFHEPISSVLANKLLEFDCRGLSIPSKHVRSPPASPIPNWCRSGYFPGETNESSSDTSVDLPVGRTAGRDGSDSSRWHPTHQVDLEDEMKENKSSPSCSYQTQRRDGNEMENYRP